jgi:hypothetical protein
MTHSASFARRSETCSLEGRIDRAACELLAIRLPAQHRHEDLLAAPISISLEHTQHRVFDIRRRWIGMGARRTRQIAQTFRTERLRPIQDLVAGLAADPELTACINQRQAASLHSDSELHPLVPRVGLGPTHPWTGPAAAGGATCECYP